MTRSKQAPGPKDSAPARPSKGRRPGKASKNTPRRLGYRMPAEWHPHESTWLTFPINQETWPARMESVRQAYLEMITTLLPHERVDLLVDGAGWEERIRGRLRHHPFRSRLRFHRIATVDAWIRDYGPIFLIRDSGDPEEAPAIVDWGFNAWGGKYEDLARDDHVPASLEKVLGAQRFVPGIVLEGGSIEVDGQGSCLTTEQCLLNPNRNPGMEREALEEVLREYLGLDRVLWLGSGIEGDDTDGHIDDVARFTSEDTIVCVREEDPQDPNFPVLEDNWERLKAFRRPGGEPYRVVALPMPAPIPAECGRLPASYANFYIANRVVMLPTFDDPKDAQAQETLQSLFPDRQVVGIDSRDLVHGLGAIHCLTQQQPATE